jgi:DNA invertase Pin-like site-specific DNA recombinase
MGGMKYGYARVSTDDQNPALQLAALKKAYRELRRSAPPFFAA